MNFGRLSEADSVTFSRSLSRSSSMTKRTPGLPQPMMSISPTRRENLCGPVSKTVRHLVCNPDSTGRHKKKEGMFDE